MIWVLLKKKKDKTVPFWFRFSDFAQYKLILFCVHNPLTLSFILASCLSLKMGLLVYGILPLIGNFIFQ